MQSKDIKVGQNYAAKLFGQVLATKYDAYLDVVQVTAEPKGGKVETTEGSISIKRLVCDWDEYLAAQKQVRADAASALERRNENARAIRAIVGDSAPYWVTDTVYPDGSYSRKGEIDLHSLRILIDIAYKAGFAAASDRADAVARLSEV